MVDSDNLFFNFSDKYLNEDDIDNFLKKVFMRAYFLL